MKNKKQPITRNIERDKEVNEKLLFEGWFIIRLWEEDIRRNPMECVLQVKTSLSTSLL